MANPSEYKIIAVEDASRYPKGRTALGRFSREGFAIQYVSRAEFSRMRQEKANSGDYLRSPAAPDLFAYMKK